MQYMANVLLEIHDDTDGGCLMLSVRAPSSLPPSLPPFFPNPPPFPPLSHSPSLPPFLPQVHPRLETRASS